MEKKDLINQNKVFLYIALATGLVLLLPLLAMQFDWVKPDPSNLNDVGVQWTIFDFVVAGTLLFGAGSTFALVARMIPKKYRLLVGIGFALVVLLIWAHLAVGIVDSWPLAGS